MIWGGDPHCPVSALRQLTGFLHHNVALVQKLRKSFLGEIEFLGPSCSAGPAPTPDTLFEKIYRRFVNCVMRKSAHQIEQLLNHNTPCIR